MERELSGVVLLISEDEALARSIGRQLQDDGLEIAREEIFSDARLLLQRTRADLVAVDMSMRSLNGERLIELSACAKEQDIPFVLLSSRPPAELADLVRLICATGAIGPRTAAGDIAIPVRRWLPGAPEIDIGPLMVTGRR